MEGTAVLFKEVAMVVQTSEVDVYIIVDADKSKVP